MGEGSAGVMNVRVETHRAVGNGRVGRHFTRDDVSLGPESAPHARVGAEAMSTNGHYKRSENNQRGREVRH
jgi:hypothetical protein